jgi:VanZ family protein
MTAGPHYKIQSPSALRFTLHLSVLLAWAATISWLSLTNAPPQVAGVLGWDKLLHAGAYGLLSLLVAQFLFCLPLHPRKIWWSSWLVAICFGALMEILQRLTHAGRTAEWQDLLADAVGAFLACVIFSQFSRLNRSRYKRSGKDHG